jgi:hypothetical protein
MRTLSCQFSMGVTQSQPWSSGAGITARVTSSASPPRIMNSVNDNSLALTGCLPRSSRGTSKQARYWLLAPMTADNQGRCDHTSNPRVHCRAIPRPAMA